MSFLRLPPQNFIKLHGGYYGIFYDDTYCEYTEKRESNKIGNNFPRFCFTQCYCLNGEKHSKYQTQSENYRFHGYLLLIVRRFAPPKFYSKGATNNVTIYKLYHILHKKANVRFLRFYDYLVTATVTI